MPPRQLSELHELTKRKQGAGSRIGDICRRFEMHREPVGDMRPFLFLERCRLP
jgi:hypothetical protein